MSVDRPLLRARGLSRIYYLDRLPVVGVREIDLDLFPGELTALEGPSGSGKSTLLNLLGLLDRPDSGTLELDGQDVRALDELERSRIRCERFGFIFQSFNLVPVLTARENVALPMQLRGLPLEDRRRRATALLEEVGLGDKVNVRPDLLSGGQRQRVAIARALANDPEIVFADEPTASLDSRTAAEILELMRRLSLERGVAFLFATHDPRVVAGAGRVLVVRDGRVVEERRAGGADSGGVTGDPETPSRGETVAEATGSFLRPLAGEGRSARCAGATAARRTDGGPQWGMGPHEVGLGGGIRRSPGVWRLALRNLERNRRRSLLTVGIVLFGFASIALAGGFMLQSFAGLKEGTITSGVGHLQLAARQTFEEMEEKTLEHGVPAGPRVASILKADPRVASVLPRIDFMGLASNGARSIPFVGVGLDPPEEARTMGTAALVRTGRWLERRDEQGAVLGTGLARALNFRPGDTVTLLATSPDGVLNALDLPVAGLIEIPVKELNDRYLATSIDAASQLLGVDGLVSKLVLMLHDEADLEGARAALVEALRKEGIALESRSWEELAVFYRQVRLLYMAIFGFMGLILVIMVLLACANTMTMAVSERVREIGTLRAMGTPPASIRRLFIAEGALLGLVGGAAGTLTALGIRAGVNLLEIQMPPPPGATQGGTLHIGFYGITYVVALVVMVLTLAASAWIPARKAARIPIVEALAHV